MFGGRYLRHPNYAGELLFWSGSFLASARSLHGGVEWATAGAGLAAAWATMLGATQRLEAKQRARYGGEAEFGRYVRATGALMPRGSAIMPKVPPGLLRLPRVGRRGGTNAPPPPGGDT
jgi:steroid 5-alpha reductase family enzyme